MKSLIALFSELASCDSLDLFTCLASFTDSRDSWTRSESADMAHKILGLCQRNCGQTNQYRWVDRVCFILREVVRPSFQKNPVGITEQGRKASYPLTKNSQFSDMEVEPQPWNSGKVYILTVFRWSLLELTVYTCRHNLIWHDLDCV